jgi:hypothetical protein
MGLGGEHGQRQASEWDGGSRPGNLALASIATSSRLFELDSTAGSNNTARVLAPNVSSTAIDLAAATLSAQVTNGGHHNSWN